FFFSSRRRHTRSKRDWSSDVCSSDLFFLGPILGLIIIFLRRHIPESPRWMLSHGHAAEAEQLVDDIEAQIQAQGYTLSAVPRERSEERRVGKEWRGGRWAEQCREKRT